MAFDDVFLPQLQAFIDGELSDGERKLAKAAADTSAHGLGAYPLLASVATAIYSARKQRTSADIVSSAVDRLEEASRRSTDGLIRATWVLAGVAFVQALIMAWGIFAAAR